MKLPSGVRPPTTIIVSESDSVMATVSVSSNHNNVRFSASAVLTA